MASLRLILCIVLFVQLLQVDCQNCPGSVIFDTKWLVYKSRPCDKTKDNCDGYMIHWNEGFHSEQHRTSAPPCMEEIVLYYGGTGECCTGWKKLSQRPLTSGKVEPFIIRDVCKENRQARVTYRYKGDTRDKTFSWELFNVEGYSWSCPPAATTPPDIPTPSPDDDPEPADPETPSTVTTTTTTTEDTTNTTLEATEVNNNTVSAMGFDQPDEAFLSIPWVISGVVTVAILVLLIDVVRVALSMR